MIALKQKKKFNTRRLGIMIFIIIMLSIVLWQIMVNRTETQTATKVTVNDSFMANGWFFRNEVVVQGTTGDTVKHIVQGGEKVQKNAALAIVYANANALESSQKISVLDDQIELLENTAQMITTGSDTVKIESMITSKIVEISSQMQQSTVSGIQSGVNEFRNLCLRRAIDTVDKEVLVNQAQSLKSERNYLLTKILLSWMIRVFKEYSEILITMYWLLQLKPLRKIFKIYSLETCQIGLLI